MHALVDNLLVYLEFPLSARLSLLNNNNLFYFRQLRSISLRKQNKQKQRQEAHMYKRHAYLQITPEEYDCSTRNTGTN